jgi:hypothetical protein
VSYLIIEFELHFAILCDQFAIETSIIQMSLFSYCPHLNPRTSPLLGNPLQSPTAQPKTNKTPTTAFKPRPTPSSASLTQGTKQYQLRKYAEQTLGSGNLRNAVVLPEGEEVCEWVAVHGKSRSFLGWRDCVAEAF